jgi:hypothetical protein
MNQIDFKSVESFFSLVHIPNYCCEVRCFDAEVDHRTRSIIRSKQSYTVAGWFTSFAELRCELARVKDVSCYISVNPVKIGRRPAHAKNTLKVLKKGEFTIDSDIDHIRFIIIDIDPIRLPSQNKINSTNQELFECINVRDKIIQDFDLKDKCIYGISGNGSFILIDTTYPKIDNTIENKTNISKFINYVSEKYSNKHCVVDTNSANASRMLGIPGTWKLKSAITSHDRPHRRVEIHGLGATDDAISQASSIVRPA